MTASPPVRDSVASVSTIVLDLLLLRAIFTSQDAFAERSLVDLPTVELKLIFEFVNRSVGGNTVPQLYIL